MSIEIDFLILEVEELRNACAEKQRCIDSSVAAQREFLAEIDQLRAELAVLRGRIADDAEHRAMGERSESSDERSEERP